MGRAWSSNSQAVYDTLDPRLQVLVTRLRDEVGDISLTCGFRDEQAQTAAFLSNTSTLQWPDGRHNKLPSLAVDLQPYPYPSTTPKIWGALGYLAGRAMGIAKEEGITIRWGGDWNMNGDLTDQIFDDLFHIEVVL